MKAKDILSMTSSSLEAMFSAGSARNGRMARNITRIVASIVVMKSTLNHSFIAAKSAKVIVATNSDAPQRDRCLTCRSQHDILFTGGLIKLSRKTQYTVKTQNTEKEIGRASCR